MPFTSTIFQVQLCAKRSSDYSIIPVCLKRSSPQNQYCEEGKPCVFLPFTIPLFLTIIFTRILFFLQLAAIIFQVCFFLPLYCLEFCAVRSNKLKFLLLFTVSQCNT